jgi:hypothetical protein
MAAKALIRQPSCSANITSADFFLFRRMKSELADLLLSQGSLKMSLEGVIQTIGNSGLLSWWYMDRCENYV